MAGADTEKSGASSNDLLSKYLKRKKGEIIIIIIIHQQKCF